MGRVFLLAAVALLAIATSAHAIGWSLVNAKIRHDFPAVRRITTAELAEWINDPRRPQPFLLDVRERAEFEVSHLPRAHHVAPDAPASTVHQPIDLPIVTYCSVGYRSGAFAERLRAAGFTNVVNLEGSIFRWANEGRPLFRDRQQVEMVHPYNRTWGLLLKKKHRAEVGASGL
jgi:rhodanese-related sulfurtransferase